MIKQAQPEGAQFLQFFGPLLDALRALGGSATPGEAVGQIAQTLNIPEEQQSELLPSGNPRFQNQVAWARFYLVKEGLIDAPRKGIWSLTSKGHSTALTHDAAQKIFLKWVKIFADRRKEKQDTVPDFEGIEAPDDEASFVEGAHGVPRIQGFGSWEAVIAAYEDDEEIRNHVVHNLNYWRWIHGALALVRRSPVDFEPVEEYWHRTERRILVAFFASRFAESYAPAESMRKLAFKVFRHFERARRDGRFSDPVLATEVNWKELCDELSAVAKDLPEFEEYSLLKRVWRRRLTADSFRDDLLRFLDEGRELEKPDALETSFYKRLAWFPYIGLTSLEELKARQSFFYGFYQLFTTTNAYVQGGAMSFAPILQNNRTTELIDYVERWAQGVTPLETGFEVEGKTERRNRAHHAPVIELFGFLNLHRQPFYNNRTAAAYDELSRPSDSSKFDIMARIGQSSHAFLGRKPQQIIALADRFRKLVKTAKARSQMRMEGIALKSVVDSLPGEYEVQIERQLREQVDQAAADTADGLDNLEAAAAFLHLMLDSALYQRSLPGAAASAVAVETEPKALPVQVRERVLRLPTSLAPLANDALGYLKSGYHVLFAGPPGTGKTTLAQLVGHAWNHNLPLVIDRIPVSDAPVTTVGNSAWAPLHTIGGILPDGKGGFRLEKGIFIDQVEGENGQWRLRSDCLVLDEMNRADLDRCIGELYPLLSRSVERVYPAGIPGVQSICYSERFRIIATVNDATIDDIVFPISEGLARRFVRLELSGARIDELRGFIGGFDEDSDERSNTASRILDDLFELLSETGQLQHSDLGERLPFGVGYFDTLRSWVKGELNLSREFMERDLRDQAAELLLRSLRSAARFRGLEDLLLRLRQIEGID